MSEQRSNLNPYDLIRREGTEVSYTFVTDYEIEYVIRFADSGGYFFDDVIDIGDTVILEFQFIPINGLPEKKIRDNRVADTLAHSIREMLQNRKNAIIYICSDDEDQAAARSRLFDVWYKTYSWEHLEKHDGIMISAESSEYVSLIVNTQNPYASNVVHAFVFIMTSGK